MDRLYNILDRLVDRSSVNTKSVTGTTNASGALDISGSISPSSKVIGAHVTSGDANALPLPFRYSNSTGNWYLKMIRWDTFAVLGNQSFTVDIFYLGGGYCIAVFSRLAVISSLVRRWRHEQTIQHLEQTMHSGGCNSIKYKFVYFRQLWLHSESFVTKEVWENAVGIFYSNKNSRITGRGYYDNWHSYKCISPCRKLRRGKCDIQRIGVAGWNSICKTGNNSAIRVNRGIRHNVLAPITTIPERGCVA